MKSNLLRWLGRDAPTVYEFTLRVREKSRPVAADLRPRSRNVEVSPPSPIPQDALRREFEALGIEHGDTVMVTSSWDSARGLSTSPVELVRTLQGAVGAQGTLCMPAYPVLPAGEAVFDLRRSPSHAGLVTEIFRRMPGAVRSAQLSSVAALGARAAELTNEHHLSPYAAGPLSPQAKLAGVGGKVLCLGLGAEYNPLLHCAEDILQESFPVPVYEDGARTIKVRHADGAMQDVVAYQRAKRWQYCGDGARMMRYFEDLIHRRAVNGVEVCVVAADPFVGRLLALAQADIHMYGFHFPPPKRALPSVEAHM